MALIASMALTLALDASGQTPRIASDFEIRKMERQAASEHDFGSQISAHLNLGDVRMTRGETGLATGEYRIAADIALRERVTARKASNIERYATATTFAGLAASKLGEGARAFALLEEAVRYASDDPKVWNVYASTMRELWQRKKAVSAVRNAVAIQTALVERSPSSTARLDLNIYRTTLAMALKDAGERAEARSLLETVVSSLRSPDFEHLRKDAARRESFEIYSTVAGETQAYLSLLNRSQLQLAAIHEETGDVSAAKRVYRDVLQSRNDDVTALAALARLSTSDAERAQIYSDAFGANPYSIDLIRNYQKWLETHSVQPNDGAGSGAAVRRALEQMALRENRAARSTLDALIREFPSNDVLQYLAATNDIALGDTASARSRQIHVDELLADVRSRLDRINTTAPAFLNGSETVVAPSVEELQTLVTLLDQQRLTPAQQTALDRITFTATAVLDASPVERPGQTVFDAGLIGRIRFRFSEPIVFSGALPAKTPLRMSFRVLGATESEGSDALLVEPLKLEVIR